MGCVSSNLLSNEDDFPQLGSSALGHHIVSLTSSTYGLLNLDPPPSPPPPAAGATTPPTAPLLWSRRYHDAAEVINSWDLMSGLDNESFRFPPPAVCSKDRNFIAGKENKENSDPNLSPIGLYGKDRALKPLKDPSFRDMASGFDGVCVSKPLKDASFRDGTSGFGFPKVLEESSLANDACGFSVICVSKPLKDGLIMSGASGFGFPKVLEESSLVNDACGFSGFGVSKPLQDGPFGGNVSGFVVCRRLEEGGVGSVEKLGRFKDLCPPNGENKVVIYTTTLRGIRKTFEDCNVVRTTMEGFGVAICERDVSMDRGFREELRELMVRGNVQDEMVLPRVFVKGKYVGGVEEVMRIVEEGWMGELLIGLPKKRAGELCEGCGDARFLPCFSCNGSCKTMVMVKEDEDDEQKLGFSGLARSGIAVRCPDCNENGLILCPICS